MKTVKLLIPFAFTLITCFQVSAQYSPLNTFNKMVIYENNSQVLTSVSSSLEQTHDKGYISCRSVLDSIDSNGYHFFELIKSDKTGQISWTKKVLMGAVPDSMMINSNRITQTQDSGYVGAMVIYKDNKLAETLLIKTDSLGNYIWSQKYSGEGASSPTCIKQTTDKGFIVCGYTKDIDNKQFPYIFKTDSLGNQTWGKKCTLGTDTLGIFNSILELPGQGYIVCGYSGKTAIVVELDLNGNLNWEKEFFDYSSSFYSIIKTSDNALLLGGAYMNTDDDKDRMCFAKLDLSGNILWIKGYDETPAPDLYYDSFVYSLIPRQDGFIFSGYKSDPIPASIIGRLDLDGNFEWCKEYQNTFHTFNYLTNTIINTTDGGFAFENFVGISPGYANVLLKMDSLGNGACDGNNYSIPIIPINVTVTSNATLFNSGTSQDYSTSISNSTFADYFNCATINDSILVKTESFHNTANYLSQNFPNPFSTQTTIEYSLENGAKSVSIAIYNLLGAKKYEKNNLPYTRGKHAIKFEDINLPEGIYLYSLFIDDLKITRKMIIKR